MGILQPITRTLPVIQQGSGRTEARTQVLIVGFINGENSKGASRPHPSFTEKVRPTQVTCQKLYRKL
jgi:hypothetical protein